MTSHRPRRLGLAAAALLLAVPVWWSATAHAQTHAETDADTVAFQGGCALQLLGPLGKVDPSVQQVVVASGEQVQFVNQLGRRAVLSLDGEAAVELPSNGAVAVSFHGGPVTATMEIKCLLGNVSGSTTVEVQAAAQPAPPAGQPPSPSSPQPAPPAAGTTQPPSSPAQPGSGTGSSGQSSPGGQPGGDTGSQAGQQPGGQPGSQPGSHTGPAPGTQWGPAGDPPPSASQGTPPEELTMPRWDLRADSDNGGETPPDADTVDETGRTPSVSTGRTGTDQRDSEQMSPTAGSQSGGGPNGMLALIATVCVAGVTAGAIRAILSQRAARAEWA